VPIKGKQIINNSLPLNKLSDGVKILPSSALLGTDKTPVQITDNREFTSKEYVDTEILSIQTQIDNFPNYTTAGLATITYVDSQDLILQNQINNKVEQTEFDAATSGLWDGIYSIDVLTTEGDLLTKNSSGDYIRVASGTNGQILSVDTNVTGGLTWVDQQEQITYTFSQGLTESAGSVTLGGAYTSQRTLTGSGNAVGFAITSQNVAGDISTISVDNTPIASNFDFSAYESAGTGYFAGASSNTALSIGYTDSVNTIGIDIIADSFIITDTINSKGAEYAADYSANFTARSLVDKEYVDTAIANSTSGDVESVFGRTGAVVAQFNDYNTNQIRNLSSVAGGTGSTTTALNELNSGKASTSHIHEDFEVYIRNLDSIYTTQRDRNDIQGSTALISGGSVTDGGSNGTVDISSGEIFIRDVDNNLAPLYISSFSGTSGLVLTDNSLNYIYVNYNSGSPIITVSTTLLNNTQTNVVLGVVYRDGNTTHITNVDVVSSELNRLLSKRLTFVDGIERQSGSNLTESGTRNISITEGRWWLALDEYTTTSFDSSVSDTFTYYYMDGLGGWTSITSQTQINNTQYDDGSGTLATLFNNRYGVHWVYQELDNDVIVIFGKESYTLVEAQAATPPESLPAFINNYHSVLIGKVIIAKNASTFTEIQYPLDIVFTPSSSITLQGVYNNSGANPEIVTNDTNGDLTLRRGSTGGNTDAVFTIQNNSGTTTFRINGDGNITVTGTIDGRDIAADGTKLDTIETGAQVNTVDSVFGRTGAIIAEASDYDASQIDNDSLVVGTFVSDALNTLNIGKASTSHTHVIADITDAGALASLDTVNTAQIDNDAVTYDKIQNVVANNVFLGNDNGAGSSVQELSATEARTILNVEDGATTDQTDEEIETAYNNRVEIVTSFEAKAGTSSSVYRWTPERVLDTVLENKKLLIETKTTSFNTDIQTPYKLYLYDNVSDGNCTYYQNTQKIGETIYIAQMGDGVCSVLPETAGVTIIDNSLGLSETAGVNDKIAITCIEKDDNASPNPTCTVIIW
jgi:hypothetical protein